MQVGMAYYFIIDQVKADLSKLKIILSLQLGIVALVRGWWMDIEVEMVWKNAVVAYNKVLSRHAPTRTEENHG